MKEMDLENYINATEAGKRLGISITRVIQLIKAKRLPARQFGRDWFINPADLKLVQVRVPGRPKTKKSSK
jgi:excisionase family DNA binding protein